MKRIKIEIGIEQSTKNNIVPFCIIYKENEQANKVTINKFYEAKNINYAIQQELENCKKYAGEAQTFCDIVYRERNDWKKTLEKALNKLREGML